MKRISNWFSGKSPSPPLVPMESLSSSHNSKPSTPETKEQRISRIAEGVIQKVEAERSAGVNKSRDLSQAKSLSAQDYSLASRTQKLFLEKGLNQFARGGNAACTVICWDFLQFALVSGQKADVLKQCLDLIIATGVGHFNRLVQSNSDQETLKRDGFSSWEIKDSHMNEFPGLEVELGWRNSVPDGVSTEMIMQDREDQFITLWSSMMQKDAKGNNKDTAILLTCRGYTYAILHSFTNNEILLFDSHGEEAKKPAYILSFQNATDLQEWFNERFPYQKGKDNRMSLFVVTKKEGTTGSV